VRERSISSFFIATDVLPLDERFPSWLARETRRNARAYAPIVAFVLSTLLLATFRGHSFLPFLQEYFERVVRALLLAGSAIVTVVGMRALAQGRQRSPVENVVSTLRSLTGSGLVPRYIHGCVLLACFMAAFLYDKMLIPQIVPFQWDETFARWDYLLFAGHHPWQILHPLLASPLVTIVLDVAYSSWVPIVFLFWAGALASPRVPEALRLRYWMATVASWILLGLVMATLLSSAGPCYFAEFAPGAANPYAGLEAYLAEVSAANPLASTFTKEFLWEAFTGQHSLPGGISAMPSMHNAQAALFVAFAYSLNRRFGHVMLAYAALIFLGSIHLAWHYAIDGIVGVAGALAIWWACGLIFDRHAKRTAPLAA
jgi:hypothetical protein